MERQPSQTTIWLVIPFGVSLDRELAAVMFNSVAALSKATSGAVERRLDEGCLPAANLASTAYGPDGRGVMTW